MLIKLVSTSQGWLNQVMRNVSSRVKCQFNSILTLTISLVKNDDELADSEAMKTEWRRSFLLTLLFQTLCLPATLAALIGRRVYWVK